MITNKVPTLSFLFLILLLASCSNKISIAKYGAIPDDGRDDSFALQAAIDKARRTKNNAVYIRKEGVYEVSGIDLYTSLIGKVNGIIFKLPANTQNWMIHLAGEEIEIDNLSFDGNAENQQPTRSSSNYSGYAKYSLLQSFYYNSKLAIRNCNFFNTKYGGVSIMGIDYEYVNNEHPQIENKYPFEIREVESIVFDNCTFKNIDTEAIRYYNSDHSYKRNGNNIEYQGNVHVTNCEFINVGTVSLEGTMAQNLGNCTNGGNWNRIIFRNNNFFGSARFDIKIGQANYILSDNNKTINPYLGHVQTQTAPRTNMSKELNSGSIVINKVKFYRDTALPMAGKIGGGFYQGSGSLSKKPNHAFYDTLTIKNCEIEFGNEISNNPNFLDVITISSHSKYNHINIIGNKSKNHRRYFINVGLTKVDDFHYKTFNIERNAVIGNQGLSSYFLFFQSNGNKIDTVNIKHNTISGIASGIGFNSDAVKNMNIISNDFKLTNKVMFQFLKENDFDRIQIEGNAINGIIDPTRIKSKAKIFNNNKELNKKTQKN